METRQEIILRAMIEEYIRTAEPVGSKFLALQCGLSVSPATIRNDMSALEDAGYIRSPHTSAGRVPTEKGYAYYLRHFVEPSEVREEQTQLRHAVSGEDNQQSALKMLGKALVDLSGETVIIAFDPRWSYSIGIANLFQKPDFQDLRVVQSLSELVDRFDDVISEMFEQVAREPQVMIGSGNPFGSDMTAIVVKYALPHRQVGVLGLVGPLRMDYQKNLRLMQEAKEILDEIL